MVYVTRLVITAALLYAPLFLYAQSPRGIPALVAVPVVDLAASSLCKGKEPVVQKYDFPFAPDKGHDSCLRVHQLKFNETVIIVSDPSLAEVECVASNFYYLDKHTKKRSNFWMLKEHLVPLKKLAQTIDLTHIPQPISLQQLPREYNKHVLTLTMPWQDRKSNNTYSVGTRFCRCPSRDTKDTYAVYLINGKNCSEEVANIARTKALVHYPTTPQKATELFVILLKKWAHQKEMIPYVYGGCSFIQTTGDRGFYRGKSRKYGHPTAFWQRKGTFSKPLAGFDCSGLVLTAAQVSGIPYYCKNTYALMKQLRPLEIDEPLEKGDLLWYNHHVMIVSDVSKNLLIEAVGYDSGYGKLHEIEVKKLFRGITDYKGLIKAHHTKHALMRLNSKGKPYKTIHRLKILKLKSVWE